VAGVVEEHEARVGDVVEDRDRCRPALFSLRAMRRWPANCSRWPTTIEKVRFASDAPLEGDGFEPSVPHQKDNAFRGSPGQFRPIASRVPRDAIRRAQDVDSGDVLQLARSITARKSRQYPNLKTALHERASFLRGLALWRAVQAHHLMALRLFEGAQ